MRSLKECSDFTSWWWMPLPSISPLFSCYYSAVVFCAQLSTCNSAPPIFSKTNFQSNFHPFSPRLLFIKQHKYCTRTLSDLFQCYAVIFYLQIASSSRSGSQNMKNQRTVICPGVFVGGERTRIKEPSVEVISEASKNQQFSGKNRHRTCD